HARRRQVMLINQNPTLVETKTHDVADIIWQGDDLRANKWFFDPVELARIRHFTGIVYDNWRVLVLGSIGYETYVRNSGDYCLVEFPLESFLNNFHMEHSKKAASETKAKC